MKIKLDENLPFRLVAVLQRHGYDVDTVPQEQLTGGSDADVWHAARAANRLLITQDMDFSDSRSFSPGTHAGLLLVRLRDPGVNALTTAIEAIAREIVNWHGCFVVLTDTKIRIKHP